MDIYLVRHGQTDGNVARRHQHPNIGLNEKGRAQAQSVAQLLRQVRPTHIIASTNPRALETARFIGLVNNIIPETHPAFEEMHRPEYLIGERMLAFVSLKYVAGWFLGLKSAPMHDGESYEDFRRRILEARDHLASLPNNTRVIVVTHSVFINFFLEHMNRPKKMGLSRAALRFIHIIFTKNTAVVHLRHNAKKSPSWRIM